MGLALHSSFFSIKKDAELVSCLVVELGLLPLLFACIFLPSLTVIEVMLEAEILN